MYKKKMKLLFPKVTSIEELDAQIEEIKNQKELIENVLKEMEK